MPEVFELIEWQRQRWGSSCSMRLRNSMKHRFMAAMILIAFAISGQLSGCACAAAAAMHFVRDHQGDVRHFHQTSAGAQASAGHDGCTHSHEAPADSKDSHPAAQDSSSDCGCAGCGDICSHVLFLVQRATLDSPGVLPVQGVFTYAPADVPAGPHSIFQPPKLVSA